jgi:preprotein translocase subunit SecE
MNPGESLKQPVQRAREFLEECWSELKKVSWPSRKETQAATMAVIVGVVVVAAYLGVVDFILTKLVQTVLG